MPDREGIASNPSEMDEYCRRSGFVSWFETSAKENHGIDNAARALIDEVTPLLFLDLPSSDVTEYGELSWLQASGFRLQASRLLQRK